MESLKGRKISLNASEHVKALDAVMKNELHLNPLGDCVLRLAELQDYEKIVQLVNDAYWKEQSAFFIDNELSRTRINLEEVNRICETKGEYLFVLYNPLLNQVWGVVWVELKENESYASWGLFALDPICRGKKMGLKIISQIESWVKELGRDRIIIEVFSFAENLGKHYQTMGYQFTGENIKFIHSECLREEFKRADGQYLRKMEKKIT